MDAYTLNLVFLFVALLCQVPDQRRQRRMLGCAAILPRQQRFTWLALSLAGLLSRCV